MKIRTTPFTAALALLACCSAVFVQALEAGATAPQLMVKTLKNHPQAQISLNDYRGKVVYVDFWASWCGPCQESFPVLERLRARYQSEGFEVVGINLDENTSDADTFLKKFPVHFPLAADPEGRSAESFKIKGMPSAYLIDKKGVVRHVVVGFQEGEAQSIETMVARLLEEK